MAVAAAVVGGVFLSVGGVAAGPGDAAFAGGAEVVAVLLDGVDVCVLEGGVCDEDVGGVDAPLVGGGC